jgi:hypothetical protein
MPVFLCLWKGNVFCYLKKLLPHLLLGKLACSVSASVWLSSKSFNTSVQRMIYVYVLCRSLVVVTFVDVQVNKIFPSHQVPTLRY